MRLGGWWVRVRVQVGEMRTVREHGYFLTSSILGALPNAMRSQCDSHIFRMVRMALEGRFIVCFRLPWALIELGILTVNTARFDLVFPLMPTHVCALRGLRADLLGRGLVHESTLR